jgi:hypothetical protein
MEDTTMSTMMRRAATAAVLLAACAAARPCEAGPVTWQFVETFGGVGVSGTIGGLLTLNSPPVDLTPGASWTATTPDLVDLTIKDPNIGPVGPYDVGLNVASILEGIGPLFVNLHEVSGSNAAGDTAFSNISGTLNASDLGVGLASGGGGTANGNWVLVTAAVPEPSSLVMAGSGALIVAGYCSLRRRKSASTV